MRRPAELIGVAFKAPDGRLFTLLKPARHFNLVPLLPEGVRMTHRGQGFVDADGKFLTRQEARDRALATGQCKQTRHQTDLFSEDLW